MIRLRSVTLTGLKRDGRLDVDLGPVLSLVGSNGSGKSAVLGAITYALAGRVAGVKAGEIGLLAPTEAFSVVLEAASDDGHEKVTIARGQKPKGFASAKYWHDKTLASDEASGVKGLEVFVEKHFGEHAEFFINAFDPEKNIWSMSGEARARWTFAAVASQSGWGPSKLVLRLQELFGDQNPFAQIGKLDDVVTWTERMLVEARERARTTKRAVAEYEVVIGSMTDPISEPDLAEIDKAKHERSLLMARGRELGEMRRIALQKEALEERRTRTSGELDAARQAAQDLLQLSEAETLVAESERELHVKAIEIETGNARIRLAKSEIDKKRALLARDADCPTCARALSGADIERLNKIWDDELRFCASEGETLRKHETLLSEARVAVETNKGYLAARRNALLSLGALTVPALEKQLAEVTDRIQALGNPLDKTDLDRQVAMNENALDLAESKLSDLTNRQHLAKERDKKRREASQATLVAAARKGELEKLESLRSEILEESRSALKAALLDEDHALAPHGGRYTLDIGEGGLEFGYVTGTFRVPWRALSTGEKTVATTVLSVALRRLLGAQVPWSALLIDNLEVVSLPEREKLVSYVRGLSGLVSNVLLISSDERGLGEPAVRF